VVPVPLGGQARRRRDLAAAHERQEAERRAARQRLLELAKEIDPQHCWNLPTNAYRISPLLTPGQTARSRQGGHW
jgi:hypothetical protein